MSFDRKVIFSTIQEFKLPWSNITPNLRPSREVGGDLFSLVIKDMTVMKQ